MLLCVIVLALACHVSPPKLLEGTVELLACTSGGSKCNFSLTIQAGGGGGVGQQWLNVRPSRGGGGGGGGGEVPAATPAPVQHLKA